MRRTVIRWAALLALGLAATGCEQRLEPQQVAERYWKAVVARDVDAARPFVTRESRTALRFAGNVLPVGDVRFGRTVIDGTVAQVETTVTLLGDKPLPVPLATHLREEDGQWRVDSAATMAMLAPEGEVGAAVARLRELNAELAERMDRSMAELQRQLPEIEREVERFRSEIGRRVPAVRKELEDFARRLEEALKNPPPAAPAPPADTSVPPATHAI